MGGECDPRLSFAYEFVRYIVILVSIVVLFFDHCLTFSSEVEHIWNKKKTPFSCLFLLNRYFALSAMLAYALYIVPQKGCPNSADVGPIDDFRSQCGGASPLIFAFTVVISLTAEAAITLRAYAVHRNSKPVLFVLSTVWLAHLAISLYVYVTSKGAVMFSSDHGQAPGISLARGKGVLFVTPAIVFDILAGGFLTLGLYHQSGPERVRMPLTSLIIRDGLLYFAVVCMSNAIWVAVHVMTKNYHYDIPLLEFTPIEIWSGCITTTMISRLTLNLRMYDPAVQRELTFQTMSLRFRQTRQFTTDDETRQAGGE